MGFLKKLTRPISRVLDKIVPNEIKPALPFLAAAAPFMAPGIMGIGGNTMLSRALLSGGLNLGAQLAQEGSEGDFNPLSVALASGIGALSAPGAAEKIRSFGGITEGVAPEGFKQGGLEYLAKSADFLGPAEGGAVDILGKGGTKAGFDMATAKAASIPLTQGTMDLAFAEQNRLNKQQIIDDALGGLGEGASDADRALAIRLAMQQYGFTDDEIEETITSAGYKDGGIIGLQVEMIEGKKDGGRINFGEGGISLDEQQMEIIKGGGPKIVGLLADADKMMGTEGDRLDMALKMLLRDNEDNELLKYMLDTAEERGTTKLDVLMDLIKSQRISDISAFDRGKKSLKDDISVKDLARKEGSMKDGGLMDLGGKEMDLRKGGFVPIGKKEKADDVPARLSKNEFVMTADAVRAAGGGSVNKGAKRMYDLMDRLEARV